MSRNAWQRISELPMKLPKSCSLEYHGVASPTNVHSEPSFLDNDASSSLRTIHISDNNLTISDLCKYVLHEGLELIRIDTIEFGAG